MDPGSSTYAFTFDGKDALAKLVRAEYLRRGGEHFRQVVNPRRRRRLDLLSRRRDSRSYSGDAVIPEAHVVTLRAMPIRPSMAG